jgi:transcriptional regulator with XRE-family HTH domain
MPAEAATPKPVRRARKPAAAGSRKATGATPKRRATANTAKPAKPSPEPTLDPLLAMNPALGLLPNASTLASAEQLFAGLANFAPNRVTRQVKNMAEKVMDWAGTAAEVAVGATAPLIKEPARRAAMEKAGAVLRDARETAGLSASDVATALNFSDSNVLDLAENGRIALSFEVILRLAALLARNDPIPFVMNLTRVYNPGLWKIIEQLGIGRLALHVGREREFINIYRSLDDARHLSDAEYKRVLAFTDAGFRMAVDLALQHHREAKAARGDNKGDKGADKKP